MIPKIVALALSACLATPVYAQTVAEKEIGSDLGKAIPAAQEEVRVNREQQSSTGMCVQSNLKQDGKIPRSELAKQIVEKLQSIKMLNSRRCHGHRNDGDCKVDRRDEKEGLKVYDKAQVDETINRILESVKFYVSCGYFDRAKTSIETVLTSGCYGVYKFNGHWGEEETFNPKHWYYLGGYLIPSKATDGYYLGADVDTAVELTNALLENYAKAETASPSSLSAPK